MSKEQKAEVWINLVERSKMCFDKIIHKPDKETCNNCQSTIDQWWCTSSLFLINCLIITLKNGTFFGGWIFVIV